MKPDNSYANDAEGCWCTDCIRKLIEAHDAYLQRWVDKRLSRASDEPVSG